VQHPNTDKRRRERPFPNGIELFLLLMISRRVDSLYEIRQKTGINPGAISHAIARLQKKGAITWAPEGYRRKRKLTVTQEGHKVLRNNWPNALEEAIDGPQVLARAALIVLMKNGIGAPASGADLLRKKADAIERSVSDAEPPELNPRSSIAETSDIYLWIKGKAEFHHAKGIAAALRDIADVVAAIPEDD
jgi:DNA-binding MarR family transcriptional regulator